MHYRRILTIQDISCLGQCSMTVAHPILSACGHEVCMLPAAILSTHTGGFGNPAVMSLTGMMKSTIDHWRQNGITFDVILVGYLGSLDAVEIVSEVMDSMLSPGGITIVDPAMADHGRLYSGLSEEYAQAMGNLCRKADVMIPNLTEAAMMTGIPCGENPDGDQVRQLLNALACRNVLLTGVSPEKGKTGFALKTREEIVFFDHEKVARSFHGTGDIFAAAFTGAYASGKTMADAARIGAEFTLRAIRLTCENPAHWYGVKFEEAIPELLRMLGRLS